MSSIPNPMRARPSSLFKDMVLLTPLGSPTTLHVVRRQATAMTGDRALKVRSFSPSEKSGDKTRPFPASLIVQFVVCTSLLVAFSCLLLNPHWRTWRRMASFHPFSGSPTSLCSCSQLRTPPPTTQPGTMLADQHIRGADTDQTTVTSAKSQHTTQVRARTRPPHAGGTRGTGWRRRGHRP